MTLRRTTPFALAAGLIAAVFPAARGGDIGAVGSGNWSSTTTWTGGAAPGSGDDVFIGGNRPAGAAQSAAVALTGDAAARNLYLGYNNNGQGVLNLGDSRLTLNSLTIGASAGTTGTITRGTGSFTTNGLTVNNGNSLTLEAGDIARDLSVQNGSAATTSAVGNVTNTVSVGAGSTLSLGADLAVGGTVGGQGTVDANGHSISAYQLALGSGGTNLVDRGDLHLSGLTINGALPGFQLTAADSVNGLTLNNGASMDLAGYTSLRDLSVQNGSAATTSAVGNVTNTVSVGAGSTLSLGADLAVGGTVGGQGTVDANGHSISAYQLALGSGGTNLVDRGDLRISSLLDINGPLPGFEITAGDTIGSLRLSNHSMTLGEGVHIGGLTLQNGSSLTTTSTGNVTSGVNVGSGSTLSLGADLAFAYGASISGQGTIDANGHAISAYQLALGSGGTNLVDRGDLNLSYLTVNGAGADFHFNAADSVGALNLNNGSHATTSATGNITSDLGISEGSTLSLGADLAVKWFINASGTIDANGHDVYGVRFTLTGPDANLIDATVSASGLTLNAADITLNALGSSVGGLDLKNGSTLTLIQTMGDAAGFSVDGNHWLAMGGVAIDSSSTLALIFADTPGESWLFRWQGSWLSELDSMIAAGRITVATSWEYDVVERNGYTYIMQTSAAVPEPASVVMMGLGVAGGVGVLARRRKATTTA